MSMTKRDFELIAETLAKVEPSDNNNGLHNYWLEICNRFADLSKSQNKRFNKERFLSTCKFENLRKI
jgi:hypothetical protein